MTVRPVHVWLAAVALTGLNAAKPAVVDDTAYLLFARHLAAHPLEPYAWELFWFDAPQPAMEVLLPPVLPYWLAAGMRLFGENLFLLKLWLFPFALLLCRAVAALLARFVGGGTAFLLFVCSPAVLPLFNVMLDIPALALGATALSAFVRGVDARSVGRCAAAGLLAGLAMQTKYTMLVVPAVFGAYAVCVGRSRFAAGGFAVAMLAAGAVFGGWELFLLRTAGESHFLFHLNAKSGGAEGVSRFALAKHLLAQFGGLACGLALVAGRAAGWPAWVRVGGGTFVVLLFAAVVVVPPARLKLFGNVDAMPLGFFLCGVSAVVTLARMATRREFDRDTTFLLAWVLLETLGMLAMSPFPAARRLVGVYLAVTVWAGRGLWQCDRWAVGLAVAVGAFVSAVDAWDAFAEKALAEQAAAVATAAPGETVWYTGHWGFQWYAERHGMRAAVPGKRRFRPGDWLVLPIPDGPFGRPAGGGRVKLPPGLTAERVAVLAWDDGFRPRTIPVLYGGATVMTGGDGPRLVVEVWRVR